MRKRLLAELPPAIVVEDQGPPPHSPWRGYQLCLGVFSEASHLVIVQDDAIVCQNFAPAVERLIEVVPEHPVCLFLPGSAISARRVFQRAVRDKKSLFLLMRQDFLPVVAVLWPRRQARELLEWVQDRSIPGLRQPYRSDDAVAGAWMRLTKQDVYVTLPSLVQHPDDVPSVKGGPHRAAFGRDRSRIARSFCEGDALEIEWSL